MVFWRQPFFSRLLRLVSQYFKHAKGYGQFTLIFVWTVGRSCICADMSAACILYHCLWLLINLSTFVLTWLFIKNFAFKCLAHNNKRTDISTKSGVIYANVISYTKYKPNVQWCVTYQVFYRVVRIVTYRLSTSPKCHLYRLIVC